MLVEIPFSPAMARAAITGRTCCTTHGRELGQRGDEFTVAGVRFRIVQVLRATLPQVRDMLYGAEGFATPADFEGTWRRLHRGRFTTRTEYWVYLFARCS